MFAFVGLFIIGGVVFITEGGRPIPVTYARRVRGMKVTGGISTYLPLRVNQAGVIPIIFALSILLFPQMIATFLSHSSIGWLANGASSVVASWLTSGVRCLVLHLGRRVHIFLHRDHLRTA